MTHSTANEPIFSLCDVIRGAALDLHRHLRHGHLEKVYETGLMHRLERKGLAVIRQYPLTVRDVDGTELGHFLADLIVNDVLIIEVKAVRELVPEHVAQLIGYLRATGIEHGLLINFGAPTLALRKLVLSRLSGSYDNVSKT